MDDGFSADWQGALDAELQIIGCSDPDVKAVLLAPKGTFDVTVPGDFRFGLEVPVYPEPMARVDHGQMNAVRVAREILEECPSVFAIEFEVELHNGALEFEMSWPRPFGLIGSGHPSMYDYLQPAELPLPFLEMIMDGGIRGGAAPGSDHLPDPDDTSDVSFYSMLVGRGWSVLMTDDLDCDWLFHKRVLHPDLDVVAYAREHGMHDRSVLAFLARRDGRDFHIDPVSAILSDAKGFGGMEEWIEAVPVNWADFDFSALEAARSGIGAWLGSASLVHQYFPGARFAPAFTRQRAGYTLPGQE